MIQTRIATPAEAALLRRIARVFRALSPEDFTDQAATWLTDKPIVPVMTRREWDEYMAQTQTEPAQQAG